MKCLTCEHPVTQALYESTRGVSITSLGAAIEAATRVYFCSLCGHLQTEEAVDTSEYYDQDYNINTATEDEDQLYAMVDGKPVFRSIHQKNTLLKKLDIPHQARLLDFGCGPAHTTRALTQDRPDLSVHLFDVSEAYQPSWAKWLEEASTACYEIPDDWLGSFDVVVSFFALEHVADPRGFADTLYRLLKPGGQVYLLVPNVYDNVADLVVVDHLNHFSETSLSTLLCNAGLSMKYLSEDDHASAWTVIAQKPKESAVSAGPIDRSSLERIYEKANDMAKFWNQCDKRIAAFEQDVADLPAAIYGSGFYGCYFHTRLENPDRVKNFVDRNPHQQKKKLFGKPVAAPIDLPKDPRAIWVGLNPRIAKQAIADLDAWQDAPYRYFYL